MAEPRQEQITPSTRQGDNTARQLDTERRRGEPGGGRLSSTASAGPKNPLAHDVPTGNAPGLPDTASGYNTGARMVPAGNAAGGTTPGGTSAKGAGGGAGLPGGVPPNHDEREPKRLG